MSHEAEDSKADQDRGDEVADGNQRQRHTEKRCSQHNDADGQEVN